MFIHGALLVIIYYRPTTVDMMTLVGLGCAQPIMDFYISNELNGYW